MNTVKFYEPRSRPIPLGEPVMCVLHNDTVLVHARFCQVAVESGTESEVWPCEGNSFSPQEIEAFMADGWTIETREEDGCTREQDVRFWADLVGDLGIDE